MMIRIKKPELSNFKILQEDTFRNYLQMFKNVDFFKVKIEKSQEQKCCGIVFYTSMSNVRSLRTIIKIFKIFAESPLNHTG